MSGVAMRPTVLIGGSGDYVTLFLDAYPRAHARIARWIVCDVEKVAPGTHRFPLEWFPRDCPPNDDDLALTDRTLRNHWLDLTLMAHRTTRKRGIELRGWLSDLVLRALGLVRRLKADDARLLFVGVPHRVEMFALLAAAWELGIDYVASFSSTVEYLGAVMARPFPFEPVSPAPLEEVSGPLSIPGRELVERLNARYDRAVPASMKVQYTNWSLRGMVARKLRRRKLPTLEGAKTFAQRRALQAYYEARTVKEPRAPYFYVPLHYQPERTTLPQGRMYADQELMVRRIAQAVPTGTQVLVREHPSTFLLGGPMWRSREFYERLSAIPGVALCSAADDPFRLLDGSIGVGTVTGTVGIEAAARGKPTMIFGAANYVGLPGMHDVGGESPRLLAPPSGEAFSKWLSRFEKSSFSVACEATSLRNERRDWAYHASGMLVLLFPERVEHRGGIRWVTPP